MGKKFGSDLIVDMMLQFDIPFAALNPGSSYRGLHDSIVNYANNRPEIIECTHEEIAVAMAHGYAKITGKPMVAIVHDVVGLLHSAMAIYYAYLDRVPVMVLGATGPMDPSRRRPNIDWIHTAVAQGQAVRDFTKWDYQPVGAEDVVDSFARGYRVATTDPAGPIYLCYDAGFQEDDLPETPALPSPREVTPTPLHPDPTAVAQLAQWLLQAERPVLIAEHSGRRPQSVEALAALAEWLGAPVIDRGERLCFPTDHPLNMTGAEAELLAAADLVVLWDVRDVHGAISRVDRVTRRTEPIIPKGCRVVEIGLGDLGIRSWSQEYQKLQPVALSILADTSTVFSPLLDLCRQRANTVQTQQFQARADAFAARHRQMRQAWQQEALASKDATPIATGYFVQEVGDALAGTDWVLTANTVRDWARRLWSIEKPSQHPGAHLGTATQIGISLGIALACRGSGRLVVDLQPDGDLLFDVGALWTAAYHQIPILVVMYNNRAYYNDWEHQILMARERGRDETRAYLGMEINRPAPDFAAMARSFGWYAEGPVLSPGDLRDAIRRARDVVLREGKPALVDVVTQYR